MDDEHAIVKRKVLSGTVMEVSPFDRLIMSLDEAAAAITSLISAMEESECQDRQRVKDDVRRKHKEVWAKRGKR